MPSDPSERRRQRIARILERTAGTRDWAVTCSEQARAKIDQQLAWMRRADELAASGILKRKQELIALGFPEHLVAQVLNELDRLVRTERISREDLKAVGLRHADLLLRRYAAGQTNQNPGSGS